MLEEGARRWCHHSRACAAISAGCARRLASHLIARLALVARVTVTRVAVSVDVVLAAALFVAVLSLAVVN